MSFQIGADYAATTRSEKNLGKEEERTRRQSTIYSRRGAVASDDRRSTVPRARKYPDKNSVEHSIGAETVSTVIAERKSRIRAID